MIIFMATVMLATASAQSTGKSTDAAKSSATVPQAEEYVPQVSKRVDFTFEGGPLDRFVGAVKQQYGVDLQKLGTVPDAALVGVEVPKLRLPSASIHGLLKAYNSLSDEGLPIGKWIIRHDGEGDPHWPDRMVPQFVVFVPPATSSREIGIRVFNLDAKQNAESKKLNEAIAAALELFSREARVTPVGNMRHHEETRTFIVVGDKAYIEVASEVVAAFKQSVGVTILN